MAAYAKLRVDLRWLSKGTSDGSALATMAFPTLDGRTANPFATEKRYYTARETHQLLWADAKQLRTLRDVGALRYEKLPSKLQLRARYNADDVDALQGELLGAVQPGSAATTLDIPVYAIGQLAAIGRLDLKNCEGIVALRGMQVCGKSVDDLILQLTRHTLSAAVPDGWIPLKAALAGQPGEKSWARVIDAMLSNRIPFCVNEGQFSVRRILVDPTRMPTVSVEFEPTAADPTGLSRVSLRDAYEIIGASDEEAMASIRSAGLEINQEWRRKSVDRIHLWSLIAKIASTSEVAARMGRGPVAIHHELRRLAIPRVHCAWSRKALVRLGMVLPVDFVEADL